jgi:hypothetical protein
MNVLAEIFGSPTTTRVGNSMNSRPSNSMNSRPSNLTNTPPAMAKRSSILTKSLSRPLKTVNSNSRPTYHLGGRRRAVKRKGTKKRRAVKRKGTKKRRSVKRGYLW